MGKGSATMNVTYPLQDLELVMLVAYVFAIQKVVQAKFMPWQYPESCACYIPEDQ